MTIRNSGRRAVRGRATANAPNNTKGTPTSRSGTCANKYASATPGVPLAKYSYEILATPSEHAIPMTRTGIAHPGTVVDGCSTGSPSQAPRSGGGTCWSAIAPDGRPVSDVGSRLIADYPGGGARPARGQRRPEQTGMGSPTDLCERSRSAPILVVRSSTTKTRADLRRYASGTIHPPSTVIATQQAPPTPANRTKPRNVFAINE